MVKASGKRKAKRTGRTGAKAAKKKPAGKKPPARTRRPRRPRRPEAPAPPPRAPRGVAGAPECLDPPEALDVIRACLGGILPALDTPLGHLFPSPERRKQFCRCVGKSAGASFPCEAGTTLQEIFDAISC